MRSLCVFCGSRTGLRPEYEGVARQLGMELAQRGIDLVFGGGKVGLMGVVADSVLAHGGRAIGVIPRGLLDREVGHAGLTRLEVVPSMHERKARMAELSDGFVALPGGYGTYEEICEVVTWVQLGIHAKPCVLMDTAGYWQPLIAQLDHGVREGFIDASMRSLLMTVADPQELWERLATYRAPRLPAWMGPREA